MRRLSLKRGVTGGGTAPRARGAFFAGLMTEVLRETFFMFRFDFAAKIYSMVYLAQFQPFRKAEPLDLEQRQFSGVHGCGERRK